MSLRKSCCGQGAPRGDDGSDDVGFRLATGAIQTARIPRQAIGDLAHLVNPTGLLGIAGVFTATGAPPALGGDHPDGSLQVPWATLFNKGVTLGFSARTTAAYDAPAPSDHQRARPAQPR
jgi:hypothetical protein